MKTFVSRAPTCRYTHTHTHTHTHTWCMCVCVREFIHSCYGIVVDVRPMGAAVIALQDDGSGYKNVSGIAWFALFPCRCLWWRNKLSVICFFLSFCVTLKLWFRIRYGWHLYVCLGNAMTRFSYAFSYASVLSLLCCTVGDGFNAHQAISHW